MEFQNIFKRFNSVHNLSNYKDISLVIADSIKPLELWDFSTAKVAVDIGSGAGIPAVFLAMKLENCLFHLFEPAFKKASFLSFIKASLKLENIEIHASKLENFPAFKAEIITSRAAFKVADLIKIAKGFYDENTSFLLYKGSSVDAEISEFKDFAQIKKGQKERNFVLLKGLKC